VVLIALRCWLLVAGCASFGYNLGYPLVIRFYTKILLDLLRLNGVKNKNKKRARPASSPFRSSIDLPIKRMIKRRSCPHAE
jgi:hypothetical protein